MKKANDEGKMQSLLQGTSSIALKLFHLFLKSDAHPFAELVDYAIQFELQARGSPHTHTILWIKNAPKLNVNSDEEVLSFIDHYISCTVPENEDLAQ